MIKTILFLLFIRMIAGSSIPLCPADILCTNCKEKGAIWHWDDSEDCVYDCLGECFGDAQEDKCGVCGGDGSSCDNNGCDKECQTILISVGAIILIALLIILLLWFILSTPVSTVLTPVRRTTTQTAVKPTQRHYTRVRQRTRRIY